MEPRRYDKREKIQQREVPGVRERDVYRNPGEKSPEIPSALRQMGIRMFRMATGGKHV